MPPMIPDQERFKLLSSWCDGVIGEAEFAQFEALLRNDAGFRKFYLAYVDLHAILYSDILTLGAPGLPYVSSRIRVDGEGHGVREVPCPCSNSGRCGPRSLWLVLLSTAAALLIYGGLVLLRPSGGPEARIGDEQATSTGSERPLAVVVKVDDLRWEDGEGPSLWEGKVLSPGRLRFREGRAVLSFFSGVTLALEGPADVNLISINRVFCRLGKLRAHVPEGAEGFVIASHDSAVVDLGTELAVNIRADGKSQIMVFEGRAEAALLDSRGSPKRTQLVEKNHAFELDPRTNRIDEAAARPERFVPALKLVDPELSLGPAYTSAVLRSHPKGYWSFESIVDGAIPNRIVGGPALRVNGPVEISEDRGGNRCAVFKAGAPTQFLSTDVFWDLRRDPGHALEFWFLSERYEHVSLVGLLPPDQLIPLDSPSRFVHPFLVELTAQEQRSLNKPASVRFLHRWPLDVKVGRNLFSEHIYLAQRWHHVVAQKDGDRVNLCLDGVCERTMRLEPDHPNLCCRLVVGRRAPDVLDLEDIRPFVGRLDELAIYDRPLSAEEIRGHFQLANSKAGSSSPSGGVSWGNALSR